MPADDVDRVVHHALHVGRRLGGFAGEQIDRQAALPDRPMDRAVDGLIARSKQGFDLIVGFIDGAGAASFVLAFAPHLERRFGERGSTVGRRIGWGVRGGRKDGSAHRALFGFAGLESSEDREAGLLVGRCHYIIRAGGQSDFGRKNAGV